MEEAAGTALYFEKKRDDENLIKKKDIKLSEINGLLSTEIEPQMEKLRKDKDQYM